jgi:urease accessory protein
MSVRPAASLALLQLASPALPIGGYSYSGGLEWGIESGAVRDAAGAREWIADALALPLASFDGPLMRAALRVARGVPDDAGLPGAADGDAAEGPLGEAALASLVVLNATAIAARETEELRLESEQMGYSLGRWLAAVCPRPADDVAIAARLAPLSLPLAWALAAARLGLDERDALLGLFWTFAENQAMVLMKALPMGQIAAQRMLRELAPDIEAAIERALALPEDGWSSAAPLLAVASARHETQYSRLFRS